LKLFDEPGDGESLRIVDLKLGALLQLVLPVAREALRVAEPLVPRVIVHPLFDVAIVLILKGSTALLVLVAHP